MALEPLSSRDDARPCQLLVLPPELRLIIYDFVLAAYLPSPLCSAPPPLLLTCHAIRHEATRPFLDRLLSLLHEAESDKSSVRERFCDVLVREPMDAIGACRLASELDAARELEKKTKTVVVAEMLRLRREGFPIERWLEWIMDGEGDEESELERS